MKRLYHLIARFFYRVCEEEAAMNGRYKEAMYWLNKARLKHGKR